MIHFYESSFHTLEPLTNTYTDFWQMVWQEDVNIIAMVSIIEDDTGVRILCMQAYLLFQNIYKVCCKSF